MCTQAASEGFEWYAPQGMRVAGVGDVFCCSKKKTIIGEDPHKEPGDGGREEGNAGVRQKKP